MSKGKKEHASLAPFAKLHLSVQSEYDGGQCLNGRCNSSYSEQSCSYRWQAIHRAETKQPEREIYQKYLGTSDTITRTLLANKDKWSGGEILAASVDQWQAATGRKEGKAVRTFTLRVMAFRTGFFPFGNQVHHLLPNAELRNAVLKVTEPLPRVATIIFGRLLQQKYNINHHHNMMILPTQISDGCEMGLPTHPQGHNHTNYSTRINQAVTNALLPYRDMINDVRSKQEHTVPNPANIKMAIEAISKEIREIIFKNRDALRDSCANQDDVTVDSLSHMVPTTLGL